MRFGRGLDDPAHDLLREAGARRVDHGHVGACPPARPARASPGGCRRRRTRALVTSLRRALSIASATAASTISTPTTSRARRRARARSCRCRSRGRTRARSRAGRRARRPRRRAPRPSRCSSGRTRRARSGTRARRAARAAASDAGEPLGLAALRALAEAGGLRPEQAVARRPRRRAPSMSIAPGDVTSRTCSSPVRRPSRTTRLRRSPRWSRRSHALRPCVARPGEHLLARRVAALGREQAVVERRRSRRSGPGAWKPHTSAPSGPCRTSTRACCGSATARPRGRSARARSRRAGRCGAARRRPARP